MAKRKQVKSWKSDTIKPRKMVMRMIDIRRETSNDADRTVEVVIASENPVERYDEDRDDVVREILDMDGIRMRNPDKPQLPIVDSHNRDTIRNVLGSIRGLKVEDGQFIGRATFASDQASQDAYQKLKDGHLTDFSITATPNEIQNIQRGEKGIFRDQEIDGPVDIVSSWTPTDASLVAVGADETSTVRSDLLRSYQQLTREKKPMDPEMLDELRKRGMSEDVTTAEEALKFMLRMEDEELEKEEDETEEEVLEFCKEDEELEKADDEEEIEKADDEEEEEVKKSLVGRALAADNTRRKEIRALCRSASLKRAFADQLCDNPKITLEIARKKVLRKMINRNEVKPANLQRVTVGTSGQERQSAAMRDGLIYRSAQSRQAAGNPFRTEFNADAKPASGFEDYSNMTMMRMATEFLQSNRVQTGRMTNPDIAMAAMGHPGTINRLKQAGTIQRDDAWHVTGTFTNLLVDAMNKSLRDGYDEPTYTWSQWARQGQSVQDMKTINRIQYSEYPDLQDVPEGKRYPEGKTSDAKETYKVQKKGSIFSISWETITNDDLDAVSRVPQMQGVAARRKQNKSVYQVLTANAALADGNALFDQSTHSNDASSAAVISETSLNVAYSSMLTQTNLGGEIIGVIPKYLIVPAAISATALQMVTSQTPPTVGGSAAGTSGTQNLYGVGGGRNLEVIVEPQLDGNSTTAWYLAAANNQVDTIELTFLAGEESPILESEWCLETDVYLYKIRQTWGTAAIDHRGLFRNTGA